MYPYLLYAQQQIARAQESAEQLRRYQALRDLELQPRERRTQRTRLLVHRALTLVSGHRRAPEGELSAAVE